MDTCETVTIKTKNGAVDIDASTFDPKVHEKWTKKGEKAKDEPTDPVDPNAPAFSVTKNGKRGAASKFIVINAAKEQVGEEYDTEEEANTAIVQLLTGTGA